MNTKVSVVENKKSVDFPYLDKPVDFYTLDNGHTVIVAHKPGKLFNASTWVKTGSINEDDSITGISHFLEHLMFKGTPKYPAGAFDRILESKGAVVNAATWKDYTFYYVTLPLGDGNCNLAEAIDLHADMMLNPLVPEEEVGPVFDPNATDVEEKRERFVVIEEIRMRDDNHWTKTFDAMNTLMYKEHPYKRDVIGTAEVVASVSRETILDYYKKWYTPENMFTIITGDVDSAEVVDLVRNSFVFPEDRPTLKPKYGKEPLQKEERYVETSRQDITTGFLIGGYHGPEPKSLKESICLDILSDVLGEGKSSRMYQNLIEKQAEQVFTVTGTTQYEFRDGNVFLVQANFMPDKKEKALELIKGELKAVCEEPISEAEFEKAKKRLKVGFAEDAETVSEIGETIGHFMTVYEDISCYVNYLDILKNITIQDVQAAAKKYLDLNKISISVLIPEN